MFKKLIVAVVIVTLALGGFGCKKKPSQPVSPNQPAAPKTEVKSQAEYNEMAKKEITKENMKAELEKIDKEVRQESSGGGI
jgi:hypothetical protein